MYAAMLIAQIFSHCMHPANLDPGPKSLSGFCFANRCAGPSLCHHCRQALSWGKPGHERRERNLESTVSEESETVRQFALPCDRFEAS